MAPAIEKFKASLETHVDRDTTLKILEGFENIKDSHKKEKKAEFFRQAVKRMDELVDAETCYQVRDACACCTTGWREKAMQKIAKELAHATLEEKLQAIRGVTHMGNPKANDDGTITAGIGGEEGCPCACALFSGYEVTEPVSSTYCFCCAGHFRVLYQIALGKSLRTKAILSTALESLGKKPCRFTYEIEG